MLSEDEITEILSVGLSLEAMGWRGWQSFGLNRQQALEAIEKLVCGGIWIPGGDVMEIREGRLVHNYDNWYCNRDEGETFAALVQRSGLFATEYIKKYSREDAYFVIVPG